MVGKWRDSALTCLVWLGPPCVVFAMLWVPLLNRYRVSRVSITTAMVDAGRSEPTDAVLDESWNSPTLDPVWTDETQLITTAEKVLRGEMPGFPHAQFHLPLRAAEIETGPVWYQLAVGAFAIPHILIRAYVLSGREHFLTGARRYIVAWNLYERRARLPRGLMWNDHALSARVAVLVLFWRVYRHRPDFDPAVAVTVFELVDRSAQLLARSQLFTFPSNHGVMENLALAQTSIAFPSLPGANRYGRLAAERFQEQLGFYIENEGAVLEHSPRYQSFGVTLLGAAMRALALMHEPVPAGWWGKYNRARDLYAELRRPDGSLPVFGDAVADPDPEGPPITKPGGDGQAMPLGLEPTAWKPGKANALYPVAGYAVWWEGLEHWPDAAAMAQTVVTWSYFPGHAHKHADEMSVLFWAGGQAWWTNVGYWPYDMEGRDEAASWAGSNAPHLAGEPADSRRQSRLLRVSNDASVRFLELERRVGNSTLHRQVLHCLPDLWLVLDDFAANAPVEETWTSFPDVQIEPAGIARSYRLKSPSGKSGIQVYFLGSKGSTVNSYRGRFRPFAGWVMAGFRPQATQAWLIHSPAGASWSAVLWSTLGGGSERQISTESPQMESWGDDKNWRIALPAASGIHEIQRESGRIIIVPQTSPTAPEAVPLVPAPDPSAGREEIDRAFAAAARQYPQYPILVDLRVRISLWLAILLALQGIFFLAWRHWVRRFTSLLITVTSSAWIPGGLWLYLRYFRVK